MVDAARGGRCTFVVFEQMFEHSPEASSRAADGERSVARRTRPRPVTGHRRISLTSRHLGEVSPMPINLPVFPRAAVGQGARRRSAIQAR